MFQTYSHKVNDYVHNDIYTITGVGCCISAERETVEVRLTPREWSHVTSEKGKREVLE